MAQDHVLHLAKDHRHFVYESLSFATRRGQELSQEFMRLAVQIAAMLFAFSGLFLGFLASVPSLSMRFGFALALVSLIASMVAGLFHIKRQEKSWAHEIKSRELMFDQWLETNNGNGSIEEARAFEKGISKGIAEVTSVPLWSWILQTAFLGLAAVLLFALTMIFLFSV